jgi:hypothetical protein
MDLEKLAEALGLPKDSPADKVYSAAASVVLDGKKAKDSLSAFSDQLSGHGLKLDQGKLVKVAASTTPPADEQPREKELRERLAAMEGESARAKLSFAKAEAERMVKEGRVPPAFAEKLSKVFATVGKMEALSLSSDGSAVIKQAVDGVELLKEILSALPTIKDGGLSQLSPMSDDVKKKSEALSAKGREVAARVSGRKPETAGSEKK